MKRIGAKKVFFKTLIVIMLGLSFFLCYQLYSFYNAYIKEENSEILIYTFNEKTKQYSKNIDINADISEQSQSYDISYGVDVSEWQGEIDWNKVASSGITFAMIRCGFRQTVGSEIKEDAMFRKNIEGATAAGLRVGVYFFGTAKNHEEAIEEAEFTISLIKDYNLTYPIVYDMETFNYGRLKNVDYSTLTDNILTYTETISSYGYASMVYTYKNALSGMLDTGKLDGKLIWLAHYIEKTDYKGNYDMWQYTNEGRVAGIDGNVDLNISYFKYVDDIEDVVINPNYVNYSNIEFETVKDTVKTIETVTMRSTPTTKVPNSLGKIPYGIVLERIGKTDNFSKVVYEGRTVYIENKYLHIAN